MPLRTLNLLFTVRLVMIVILRYLKEYSNYTVTENRTDMECMIIKVRKVESFEYAKTDICYWSNSNGKVTFY